MAERYLFFNSTISDPRTYQAQDFADYFGSVLSTGLLHTDEIPAMNVSVEQGTMNTIVSPGKAIMRGHLYENTAPLRLTHSLPEPTVDRIDRIVLRLDLRHMQRNILLRVKEGMPAATPEPPELQRDEFIYEISLAQIKVRANTVQLYPEDLIDERLDEELCGLVHSLISIPTSQFQQQWDLYFSNKQDEVNQAVDDYLQALLDAEQALQDDIDAFEQQWNDWFSQQQTEGFVLQSEKGQPGGVAKQDDFAAHLAETATNAHLAKNIGIEDRNNHFTATDVEGALEELFTSVRDGKLQVRDAITNKGGIVADGDGDGIPTFDELVSGVNSILTGKRWASGTAVSSSTSTSFSYADGTGTTSFYSLTVSGLDFKPSVIIIVNRWEGRISLYSEINDGYYPKTVKLFGFNGSYGAFNGSNIKGDIPSASVTNTGFTMPVWDDSRTHSWLAIE